VAVRSPRVQQPPEPARPSHPLPLPRRWQHAGQSCHDLRRPPPSRHSYGPRPRVGHGARGDHLGARGARRTWAAASPGRRPICRRQL